jgi:hypothetical protein
MASKKELEEKLNLAYRLLQSERSNLPDRLYHALEGISSVFCAWRKADGKKGWSASLVDSKGKKLFTRQQRVLLEEAFETHGPLFEDVFEEKEMRGGAASMSDISQGPASQLVQAMPSIRPEDVSIDKLYQYITTTMDDYDNQWRSISDQLGVVRAVESQDYKGTLIIPMTPPIPVPYYILGKTIFPLIVTVLDMIRLLLGNPLIDIPMIRISLSIVLAIIDLIRGDWQTAFLTSLGIFSSGGVIIGILGKLIRNAWLLISPDLQRQLRDDIYKSSKSMVVGFLLWSFSVFSPDVIRITAQKSFDKLQEIVEKFNQKSGEAEAKVAQIASQAGVKVTFPKIPLSIVPSMDDIQNLQTIARVPEVYCAPEIQQILQPILLVPPLRLVLELLNIPTLPETVEKECRGVDTSSLSKAIVEKATPTVEVIPGSPLNQASKAAANVQSKVNAVKNVASTMQAKVNTVKNAVKQGGTRKKRRN